MFKVKGSTVEVFSVEVYIILGLGVHTIEDEVYFEGRANVTLRQVENKRDVRVYQDGIKE